MTKSEKLAASKALLRAVSVAYRKIVKEGADPREAFNHQLTQAFGPEWLKSSAKRQKHIRGALDLFTEHLEGRQIRQEHYWLVSDSMRAFKNVFLDRRSFKGDYATRHCFEVKFNEVLRFSIAKQAGEEYGRAV